MVLFGEQLATGCCRFVEVRMRPIVERALALRADAIVIGHTHPSGNPAPSLSDITATRRLKELCAALDIQLLDHLIFAVGCVHSMKAGRTLWI